MNLTIQNNSSNEMDDIILFPEQTAAFDYIENSSQNIFLTGKAGTGKSVLLRYFVQHTQKKVVVLAPTGIAAMNVGGQTIHSFFQLSLDVQEPESATSVYHIWSDYIELYKKIDAIVIDEVSMVRADIMQMIHAKLQAAREEFFEPFGGCQIIAFGDLYQLSPVPEKDLDTRTYFNSHYQTPYFFSAPVVRAFPFTTIELQQIHRQTDTQFVGILNSLRTGSFDNNILKKINSRVRPTPKNSEFITLTSTNAESEQINAKQLAALSGEAFVYEALTEGLFNPKDVNVEEQLKLKAGARVIMVRNDKDKRWANGTLGVVSELTDCSISVIINEKEYQVQREAWTNHAYKYNQHTGSLVKECIGKYYQYPIRLAYAMTIHKSQGQTYDGAIIDLNHGAFATGQTYVAFSRCKSFDNIYLCYPLKSSDILTDSAIAEYMKNTKPLALFPSNETEFEFPQDTGEQPITLADFFTSAGLEVVDKRSHKGALWVTGEINLLHKTVQTAEEKFSISGSYGTGRAIKKRYGWFTKSDK